jgi:hypothetical protein
VERERIDHNVFGTVAVLCGIGWLGGAGDFLREDSPLPDWRQALEFPLAVAGVALLVAGYLAASVGRGRWAIDLAGGAALAWILWMGALFSSSATSPGSALLARPGKGGGPSLSDSCFGTLEVTGR